MGEWGKVLAGGVLTTLVSVTLPAQVAEAADTEGERVHTWSRADGPSNTAPVTAVGDRVWFPSQSEPSGAEPWTSDGTAAGTRQLVDANPGRPSSYPELLLSTEDRLYFRAITPDGPRLWVTDGTVEGTRLVADVEIHPKTTHNVFEAPDGRVYFAGTDDDHGAELWVSDDSLRGAHLVADIEPAAEQGSFPRSFGLLDDSVGFVAFTESNGAELWTTDGTAAGTSMVVDPDDGRGSTVRSPVVYAGGKAYYEGTRAVDTDGDGTLEVDPFGYELWSSDGTPDGTGRVKDINVGANQPHIDDITAFGGRVLFFAETDFRERPWVSDGTAGGTYALADFRREAGADFAVLGSQTAPRAVVKAGGVYVSGIEPTALWVTDGSRDGTKVLLEQGGTSRGEVELWPTTSRLLPDGRLLFNLGPGARWWATDGTPTGTVTLSTRRDGWRGLSAIAGDTVFWVESDEEDRRYRLWSDAIDANFLRPVPRETIPDRKSQVILRLIETHYTGVFGTITVRSNGVDVPATPAVVIDGRKVTDVVLLDGSSVYFFPRDLKPGPHTVTVSWEGTDDIAPSSTTVRMTVQRSATSVTGTAKTVRANQRPVVKVEGYVRREGRAGTIEVRRKGRLLGRVVLNAQNRGAVRLPKMKAGSYRLRLVNPGDALTAPSSKVIRLTVKKARR